MKVTSMLAAVVLVASPISAQESENPDAIAVAEKQMDKGIEEIRALLGRMHTQINVLFDTKKDDEAARIHENWKLVKSHWFSFRMYSNFLYLYKRAECRKDQIRTHLVIFDLKKEIIEPMRSDIRYWKKTMNGSESNSMQKTILEVIEIEERLLAAIENIEYPQK